MTNHDNPLRRYRIRKKIGTGGMASVFLADDTVLRRAVALKMVHPHLLHQPETLRRFANEAQAIATLSHEHIVGIFDYGEYRSQPFIVMEYVDGPTLEGLITRHGVIPPIASIELALEILSGLCCAHEKGIYHRDIKPANIIIDSSGSVRITDFGIAYLVNTESVTLTNSFIGSPHYISPEQVSNKPIAGTTDIFSLGIVLYQCCTGTMPFSADTPHGVIHAICTENAEGPLRHNGKLPYGLADCIERFLAKDPAIRPDAKEAMSLLDDFCTDLGIVTGRERISSFVKGASGTRIREENELKGLLLRKARLAISERRFAESMRAFEQASRLGTLPAADSKLMRRIVSRSVRLRVLTASAGVVAVISALLLLFALFSGDTIPQTTVDTPSSERERTVPDAMEDTVHDGTAVQGEAVEKRYEPVEPAVPKRDLDLSQESVRGNGNRRGNATKGSAAQKTDISTVPGFLLCMSNPPWAEVYIDGIRRGETPLRTPLPLTRGRHHLKLVKRHYREWTDSVTISTAETTSVRIRLISSGKELSEP